MLIPIPGIVCSRWSNILNQSIAFYQGLSKITILSSRL